MAGRPNRRGWGFIRKLPSGRYQASYVHELVRHRAPSTYTSKQDAERWLADERRTIEREEWRPPAERQAEKKARAITFGVYAETWVDQRTTRGGQPLKSRTRLHYKAMLGNQLSPLAPLPLQSITNEVVRTWYAAVVAEGKARIASHAYGLLHAVLATAVTDGVLAANPCTIRAAMHVDRKHDPVILDVDEIGRLADAITPERLKALVLISAWCGLRWGEVTELRRSDLDVDCTTITVTRGVTHREGCRVDTPKSGRGRTVIVPPHIRPALEHHLNAYVAPSAAALLFAPARGGCHLNDKVFRGHFTTALTAIGRTDAIRIHDLRHFAGTQAARVGNLRETMSRLGHSTIQASLIYQAIASGRDAEVATQLSALVAPIAPPPDTP